MRGVTTTFDPLRVFPNIIKQFGAGDYHRDSQYSYKQYLRDFKDRVRANEGANRREVKNELLRHACAANNVDLVEFFINELKADFNAPDSKGNTPLYIVCASNYVDLVDFFIKKLNVDINARDGKGNTPLIIAAEFNAEETIEYLIAQDADYRCENEDKHTALDILAKYNAEDEDQVVMECLLNAIQEKDGKFDLKILEKAADYISELIASPTSSQESEALSESIMEYKNAQAVIDKLDKIIQEQEAREASKEIDSSLIPSSVRRLTGESMSKKRKMVV